ncbi:MupG family TIM beta-alpha barrel fold protein [Metabacillus sp. GX 13764]|uniref:MupG family TIM beta-alpha barrel fold protein n=1 Tax=Metabacillus kandeliae TaxID=2900151 RepID=UPI001E546354|nr:MupG family TIM beta-alpha barrel fold protein [Metabacillus kandeliae]MCD7034801.1 MupG family TIM beta-alpha barrel fold protein [Metabacillus kandeliae]
MIGISFYLSDPLADQRLIEAGSIGVKRAFTSLHIPEEAHGGMAQKAQKLLNISKNLGIQVCADVSLSTLKHLNIKNMKDLQELGVSAIRLDDELEGYDIPSLASSFLLTVNASTLSKREIEDLLAKGIQPDRIIGWHNYYPRRETGLSRSFFRRQNQLFSRYGIETAAFVPGSGEKRGPIFEGLPTLEDHRGLSPYYCAADLRNEGIQHIYTGDPEADISLLQNLMKLDEKNIVRLRAESDLLASGVYKLRQDFSRDVLRFYGTRSSEAIPASNTAARPAGSITMDNDGYGRYKGEIQITLSDLPRDERVNVIGRIVSEDLALLPLIQPGQALKIAILQEL